MNHYLTLARARYDEIRGELAAEAARCEARGHPDATAEELDTTRRLMTEGRELAAAIEEMTETETRHEAVAALAARVEDDTHGGGAVRVGSPTTTADAYAGMGAAEQVPNLMPTRAQVAELYRTASEQQKPMRLTVGQGTHNRAVVGTTDTGLPSVGLGVGQATREPRRLSTSARLQVQRVDGVQGVSFPVFGAGAADVVAEGATKPEYAAVTPGSATPQVIATWTSFTQQTMLSVTSFEARLRQKHAALIAKREDELLVATVLGTTGIQVHTAAAAPPAYSESLLHAAALVLASDVGAEPDLAVIAPADVAKVFGGSYGVSGETPERDLRLTLHGMDVYVSAAMTAGNAIVGAWSAASRFVVGMEPTILVDPYTLMEANAVRSRMEEAVALAVDEPTGFVHVNLDGVV